jgi:cob(I)alamin adenosyltransferase
MPTYKKKTTDAVIAKKGLVMCHIGDGKGKTTAAMGVAARASGAGLNVYILQFVKARKKEKRESGEWPLSSEIEFFNEIKIPKHMGQITTEQVGEGFVGILGDRKQRDAHMREALNGLELARKVLISNEYQVVILDEILSAVELDLLKEQDVVDLIQLKPEMTHLLVTGHDKHKEVLKWCDLVTEMKLKKHPYYQGVLAQRGIDF